MMVSAYYRARGWDEDGTIPADKLGELGLGELQCSIAYASIALRLCFLQTSTSHTPCGNTVVRADGRMYSFEVELRGDPVSFPRAYPDARLIG